VAFAIAPSLPALNDTDLTQTLAPGAPADFALVDLNLSWTVEEDALRSRAKNSPFEHRTLEGRAVETIVAGERVYAYAKH
jgi:dihydroorotase